MPVRGGLMLNQHMNVPVAGSSLQAVENVAKVLAQIVFNERAGFQLQSTEVTDSTQLCGQVQFHKVTGNIRLGEKLPESGIVRRRRAVLFFHRS